MVNVLVGNTLFRSCGFASHVNEFARHCKLKVLPRFPLVSGSICIGWGCCAHFASSDIGTN